MSPGDDWTMFCNQCEQTSKGTGCVISPGVCGKDADVQSLQEMILYGLKGMAAYANHARRLGKTDEAVSAFIEEALFATMTNVNFDLGAPVRDRHGSWAGRTSASWSCSTRATSRRFGKPSPAEVTRRHPGRAGHPRHRPRPGRPLATCCKQVEGTDVKVYTHGEMLPAHMYPKLREHPNLAGHYGGAWQKQKTEFPSLPRPDRGHHQLHPHPAAGVRRPPVHHPRSRRSPAARA